MDGLVSSTSASCDDLVSLFTLFVFVKLTIRGQQLAGLEAHVTLQPPRSHSPWYQELFDGNLVQLLVLMFHI